jgi:hypothetical protein
MRGGHGRKLTNVSEDGFIKDLKISKVNNNYIVVNNDIILIISKNSL